MIIGQANPVLYATLADVLLLHPSHAFLGGRVWQVATYMWVHTTPLGLLLSVLILWMFGPQFEQRWGPRSFVKFFVVSGIIAGAVGAVVGTLVPYFDYPDSSIGGTLNALLMAFAMAFPQAQVRLYFLIPVTARQMLYIIVLIEVVFAAAGSNRHLPTQLGGLVGGWMLITGRWRPSRWGIGKGSSGKPKRPNPGNLRIIKGSRDDDDDDDDDSERPPKYLN
jgi:membrane associated rhomboid family serine protease